MPTLPTTEGLSIFIPAVEEPVEEDTSQPTFPLRTLTTSGELPIDTLPAGTPLPSITQAMSTQTITQPTGTTQATMTSTTSATTTTSRLKILSNLQKALCHAEGPPDGGSGGGGGPLGGGGG